MEIILLENCTGDLVTLSRCTIHDWEVPHFSIRRKDIVENSTSIRVIPQPILNILITENDTYTIIGVL